MLNIHQKRAVGNFRRLSRGLLWSYLPEYDLTGSDPNPSVQRLAYLATDGTISEGAKGQAALPGPSALIQADMTRAYLMSVAIGIGGPALHNSGMGLFNNALQSSADTYSSPGTPLGPPSTGTLHTGAVTVAENNYVNCKTEWSSLTGSLRVWAQGVLQDTRVMAQDFPWAPFFCNGSQAVTKVQGNSYDARVKNIYACKSNLVSFVGLPAYGSIALSIDGAADVTVNVDGNGDGSYDMGATQFPCKVRYRIFDGAGLTGTVRGIVVVPDTYGGDVFGSTRTVLQSYPFSPKSIGSLISWQRSESLGGNTGDPVNVWQDDSGFARPLGKSGVAAPKLQLAAYNGRPVVRFDGSGQLLYSDAIATALRVKQTGTIAVALRWAPGNATKGLVSVIAGGSQGINIRTDGASIENLLTGDAGGVIGYPSGFGALNTMHVLLVEFDALRSRVRAWFSSTARLSTGAVADLDTARLIQWTTSLPAFVLGTHYADAGAATPALYGAGDIGEVITYGKRLRDADRANLMAYLNARWL